MKQLAILLTSLMIRANGQIIFPDQFEAIRNTHFNSQRNNGSGFANPLGSTANNYGSADTVSNNPSNDETYYPIASAPASASTGSIDNAQAYIGEASDPEAQYWSNHVNNLLAKGVTKFSIDMNRAIYRTQELETPGHRTNIVFSPLSLVGTLAMVLLGSAGVTFDQVSRILGLESGVDISSHSEIVHEMLGLVLKSIDAKANSLGPQVTSASSIFVQNGYPIRDEFKTISQRVYNNEVINLDFINQSGQSRQIINDWVNARTRGMISTILDEPIDSDTKLIIASALYFSGEWNQYFTPEATSRAPFAVTPNESVMVDMMYNGGTFPFYEDKRLRVKILGLPYKGYEMAENNGSPPKHHATMYVLLPTAKDIQALNRLESRLTADNIEDLIGRMKNEICVFGLPRMKLSSTLNLNKALRSLGLSSLFDPRASNLALLSPGFNETATSGQTPIFTRLGGDEDMKNPVDPAVNVNHEQTKKNNYFRYEDKRGGYSVEQWDSGVTIEKIPSSFHRKRSIVEDLTGKRTRRQKTTSMEKKSYEIPIDSTDDAKLRFVKFGDEKYKFDKMTRSKRQNRPVDEDFIRFIESRRKLPNYGLDSLRNSANLRNPGLYASDVLHKVEMDVTETGTVATAATAVTVQRGGDIKRLVGNRPFLFFIRHERSRLILFWGTVNKPTPNY